MIDKSKKEKKYEIPCKKCGGIMVKRESKYGKFLGCSKFPKCRHVISLKIGKKVDLSVKRHSNLRGINRFKI